MKDILNAKTYSGPDGRTYDTPATIIKCYVCEGKVSSWATKCPSCGQEYSHETQCLNQDQALLEIRDKEKRIGVRSIGAVLFIVGFFTILVSPVFGMWIAGAGVVLLLISFLM